MAFPNDQMSETLTVYRRTGTTGYGEAALAGGVNEDWYLEPGFKLITDAKGAEATASLFGIGPAASILSVGDEVTWLGRRYRAIDVQPVRFGGATDHTEAYFGSVA